jgi:hypothetical protein
VGVGHLLARFRIFVSGRAKGFKTVSTRNLGTKVVAQKLCLVCCSVSVFCFKISQNHLYMKEREERNSHTKDI